jgi:hypothetical protein
MAEPGTEARGSRLLIFVLIVGALLIGLLPAIISRREDVALMREGLAAVLAECRARYDVARSAEDTARADEWVPQGVAGAHAGDPACGRYRRRNMLAGTP